MAEDPEDSGTELSAQSIKARWRDSLTRAKLQLQGRARQPGWARRNVVVLAAIALVALLSPLCARVIDDGRGVVLELKGGDMLVQPNKMLPRWVEDIGAQPGQVVAKERWHWQWQVVAADAQDRAALALHRRYVAQYEGEVVEVSETVNTESRSVTVQLDDGSRTTVSVWSPPDSLVVGARLRKVPGRWEPEVVSTAARPPSAGGEE